MSTLAASQNHSKLGIHYEELACAESQAESSSTDSSSYATPENITASVKKRLLKGDLADMPMSDRIRRLVVEDFALTSHELDSLVEQICASVSGFGPLDKFLKDPDVSEVMINGKDAVYIEKHGTLQQVQLRFNSDAEIVALVERIVGPLGLRIDISSPMVDARLPDGSRLNAVIPPLSRNGPVCTIRRFVLGCKTFEDLVNRDFCPASVVEYLRHAVEHRQSVLVSGATATGKTTFLNVLSTAIPDRERLITIEDTAELALSQSHVVGLEAKPANTEGKGRISIGQLVRNSLRMRPDRIIVGEVRGPEAFDMLEAMNTGHDGSMCTIHASSAQDALMRLENLVLCAQPTLPISAIRRQISSAINIVVHLQRDEAGHRQLSQVLSVTGCDGDEISTEPIFQSERSGKRAHSLGAKGPPPGASGAFGTHSGWDSVPARRAVKPSSPVWETNRSLPEGGEGT